MLLCEMQDFLLWLVAQVQLPIARVGQGEHQVSVWSVLVRDSQMAGGDGSHRELPNCQHLVSDDDRWFIIHWSDGHIAGLWVTLVFAVH